MAKGVKSKVPNEAPNKSLSEPAKHCWLWFGLVVFLTLVTRFYKVTEPDHVWYEFELNRYCKVKYCFFNKFYWISVGMKRILAKWAAGT